MCLHLTRRIPTECDIGDISDIAGARGSAKNEKWPATGHPGAGLQGHLGWDAIKTHQAFQCNTSSSGWRGAGEKLVPSV